MPLADRFWDKVDKTGDCWLWTGAKQRNGYGRVGLGGEGNVGFAHRASYELTHGPIADGMTIDHTCGTKACVRPDHLEAVTRGDNVRRHYAKQTHCKYGHTLADALPHHGRRRCRTCNRERCARRYAKKKETV